jgi:hypothetical protein
MMETDTTAVETGLSVLGFLIALAVSLAVYVFVCYCCKLICEKCGVTPGILIWIPIVNLVPLLQVANLPVWMIILFFIPFVNLVVGVIMWAKICQARSKSPWLVILIFIPVVNIAFVPYLAFSE